MLAICILILIELFLRKPIGALVSLLKDVDWAQKFNALRQYIRPYAQRAGRTATRPVLLFYYVVTDEDTTTVEKAMIYACIAYVVIPFSLLPRVAFRLIGILDEAAAILFVYAKIKDKLTPAINNRVEETLDSWFGAEYVLVE